MQICGAINPCDRGSTIRIFIAVKKTIQEQELVEIHIILIRYFQTPRISKSYTNKDG
jgi:hypothetical protein